ncbi:MAG: hypothetical protein ACPG1A_12640, partial [Halioglobus sp.]
MPRLIKDGAIIEDSSTDDVLDLEQWLACDDKASRAVVLEPGETLKPLLAHIDELSLVMVNFPTFMD